MSSPVSVRVDGRRAVMAAHGGCAAFCGKTMLFATAPAVVGLLGGFTNLGEMSAGARLAAWGAVLGVGLGGWWLLHTSRDHRVVVDLEAGTLGIDRRALAHSQHETIALRDVRWILADVTRDDAALDEPRTEWLRAVAVLRDDRVVPLTPAYMRSDELEAAIGQLQDFVRETLAGQRDGEA